MFDYLQQFNKLPRELRERVSSPAAMEILTSLENKYGLSLAMVVMRVMIKQIPIRDLPAYFITEMNLDQAKAQALSQELQDKLFFTAAAYLGLKSAPVLSPEDKELQVLMKDNSIVLPSQEMMARCRQILMTYRKGIRTKIDTLDALKRPVETGGLGFDLPMADRLLRALDHPVAASPALPQASAALTELINKNEASAYDFKAALASGQIKAPAVLADKFKKSEPSLNLRRELEAPDQELALEAPDKILSLAEKNISVPEKSKAAAPVIETPATAPVKTDSITSKAIPVIAAAAVENVALDAVLNAAPVAVAPVEEKAGRVLKEETAAALKPAVAPDVSFKPKSEPPESSRTNPLGGIWSKLFKSKPAPAAVTPAQAVIASNHLEEEVKAAAQKAIPLARPAAASEARTKMEDVKPRPKVMGPLEELRFLDLVNFRRLGANPKEITGKLTMKIRLLEKDGYDRMVEGVTAWRQSPVNRMYVRLAQEAVAKGITLRDAVAARQAENKETLTMDEIEAIVAMNSQLMF